MTQENNQGKNPYDLTDPGNYEQDYALSWSNKIEKMLEVPDTEDMAGVIIRGNFKNTREANAILRLSRRHKKFNQKEHQELLRQKIASTRAIGGLAIVEALFSGSDMMAPGIYRAAKGMPEAEKGKEERVYHGGSDFRAHDKPQDNAERPR